jgi:hypothetical protein
MRQIQCCQVSEISAQKLQKRAGEIIVGGRVCGNILAELCQKLQKGVEENFLKKFFFYSKDKLSDTQKNLLLLFFTLRLKAAFTFLRNC